MTAEPMTDDVCAVCGHRIGWRGLGTLHHDGLLYCSRDCYRRRGDRRAVALERAILGLLAEQRPGGSICPSEVARSVAGEDEEEWGALMEPVREAARRLVADGRVEVTHHGEVTDASSVRAPFRLRAASG
ncbi:MAG: DUF3253 domain-containing protein [Nitriliruptorales bacterium]|nr:DUF3253 domain-containing protein [Nitriliruptorales bacterium]